MKLYIIINHCREHSEVHEVFFSLENAQVYINRLNTDVDRNNYFELKEHHTKDEYKE